MNPKQFLQIGGVILLVLGILGFLVADPLGNGFIWFTPAENYAHTVLGVVALVAAGMPLPYMLRKWLVIIVGLVALYFGVWGFVVAAVPPLNYYGVANLELVDNIIHLVVAVWAFMAASKK